MRGFSLPVLAVLCVLIGSGCSQPNFEAKKLVETLQSLNLTILVSYLKKFNLDTDLDNIKAATVFAPTDDAFKKFSAHLTDAELEVVLKAHVVEGWFNSTIAVKSRKLTSLAGSSVLVKRYDFSGPMVVANGGVVTTPDYAAINGLIHVVDKVMFPLVRKRAMDTLADVASVTAGFVYSSPGIFKILAMPEPGYTFFAPSNAAWSRVPFDVLKALGEGGKDVQLLLGHLLSPAPVNSSDASKSGPLFAAPLLRLASVKAVGGQSFLNMTSSDGNLLVNGAKVVSADIGTTDEVVIHVIDRVLLENL